MTTKNVRDKNDILPPDTEQLIEYLGKLYPPRCKEIDENVEKHMVYAGKVELVRFLKLKFEADYKKENDDTEIVRSIEYED